LRLTEVGRELGIVDDERWEFFNCKRERISRELGRLKKVWVQAGTKKAESVNQLLEKPISREYSLVDLLARPRVSYQSLCEAIGDPECIDMSESPQSEQVAQQVEIQIKYQGYIDRQEDEIERLKKQEGTRLPEDFDYAQMQGLSNELKQKLQESKPENIGRASRIPGMTPAAISLLLIYLKKYQPPSRRAS